MTRRPIDVAVSRLSAIKLALVILVVAAIGVSLLSYRQRRLAAAHELAVYHARDQADQRVVLRLRQEIAQKISLSNIRAAATGQGADQPLLDSSQRGGVSATIAHASPARGATQ